MMNLYQIDLKIGLIVTQMKINQITNGISNINDSDKISIVDTIYGEKGEIIYDSYNANRIIQKQLYR